jgi:CelD/BcsL family acetyltransferase involved in cellulose biosynthesis/GNAT superfamily N-acetyltransferase
MSRVQFLRGHEAEVTLRDPAFIRRWDALHVNSAWGTLFQRSRFAQIWFDAYGDDLEPVLVVDEDGAGNVVGLLPLARHRRDGAVTAVGAHQAEYQGWLSHDAAGFLGRSLSVLARESIAPMIRFMFLPPGMDVMQLQSDPLVRARSRFRAWNRGLVDLNDGGAAVERTLAKASYRQRIRGLERTGPLTFERLIGADALVAVIKEIADLCDLRQGALNGSEPFRQDPRKEAFHIGLQAAGDLLHSTVLRSGARVISAQLNWQEGPNLLLGLLAHSPFHARFSPGRVHLLQTARLLGSQGGQLLDLTPGGGYKDQFATRHDTVYSAEFFLSERRRARIVVAEAVGVAARRALRGLDLEPARVAEVVARARTRMAGLSPAVIPARLVRRAMRTVHERRELRIYSQPLVRDLESTSSELPSPPGGVIRIDEVDLLLKYARANRDALPRQRFLSEVLARLEVGERCYAVEADGMLAHYGWLARARGESQMSEVGARFEPPPDSAWLYDFYTHPSFRGRGFYAATLRAMLRDAAAVCHAQNAFIAVLATNAPSRSVIERSGFTHLGSLFEERRFGRVRRWSTMQTASSLAEDQLPRADGDA